MAAGVHDPVPLTRVAVHRSVPPFLKVTEPVGVPLPGEATVAVSDACDSLP